MRRSEPTNLGKLRASVRWREPPRWADAVMCAGLAALFAAFVMEYMLTSTFSFHVRDIGPMVAVAALAAWAARPAVHASYVGELGISRTSSSTFGTSRRLLMFHSAARVDVVRRNGKVTFVWYDGEDVAVFALSASELDGSRIGFGYAAVDAFRAYQAIARFDAGAPRAVQVVRPRASARRLPSVRYSRSTRPSRRPASRFRRYRGRA